MDEKLEQINEMILEVKNLHETFSDSLIYCCDSCKDTSHLCNLNQIISEKIEKLIDDYDDMHIEIMQKLT